jgi:hypothetical protein
MDTFDQDLLSRSSFSLDQHRDFADLGGLVGPPQQRSYTGERVTKPNRLSSLSSSWSDSWSLIATSFLRQVRSELCR